MKNKFIFAFQAENVFYVIWIVFGEFKSFLLFILYKQHGVIETVLASGLKLKSDNRLIHKNHDTYKKNCILK